MFRFLFRTIFRFLRLVVRVGLFTGLGFAAVKLVQNRRGGSPVGGGPEWTAAPPRRPGAGARSGGETPLVEPQMLHSVSLKRAKTASAGDGQETGATGTGLVAPTPTQPPKPTVPAAAVADPPKRAVAKKAAVKKAATKKAATAKKAATKKAAAKRTATKKAATGKRAVAKKAATGKRAVAKKAAVRKSATKKAARSQVTRPGSNPTAPPGPRT